MKILFVTGEAAPFITSGGLGEVMGVLPSAIQNCNKGVEVEVILPLYSVINNEYKQKMVKVCDITFNLSWRKTGATVFKLENKGVTYYFVQNSYYCDRNEIYGEYDDGERFAFFSTAVIEFILQNDNIPDVIHANDWQTALTVIYLKSKYKDEPKLKKIKSVYTIHNIEYQGKYDMSILNDIFSLKESDRNIVEFNSEINLMKGGIVAADAVTTVSQRYAEEMEHDFYSFKLSSIIKASRKKIYGIINGIDYSYYSPEIEGDLPFPYTKRGYKSGKSKNKLSLQRELGLNLNTDTPLVIMVTRLAKQKGIDLFLHIAEELLREELQIVILGTGEKEYEYRLEDLNRFDNFKSLITFDRVLAKKLYAAADILIMPSMHEPCGLSQMIAMAYGTVPIARNVGGLADSIIPYGEDMANGFLFNNYNAHELLYTVKMALAVYKDNEAWAKIVKNGLKQSFTWNSSALKYISVYKTIMELDVQ